MGQPEWNYDELLWHYEELVAKNKGLNEIIIEAKICAAALCIAELPSIKGLKEICLILNKGIDKGDIEQALKTGE